MFGIKEQHISHFAHFYAANFFVLVQGICGVQGGGHQDFLGVEPIVGAGVVAGEAHVVAECIRAEIGTQRHYHVGLPHLLYRGNRQFLDVLGRGQHHCYYCFLRHRPDALL